jgi:hypothetical protein
MKPKVAAVLSLAGILATGTAALVVNTQTLDNSSYSDIGKANQLLLPGTPAGGAAPGGATGGPAQTPAPSAPSTVPAEPESAVPTAHDDGDPSVDRHENENRHGNDD